MARGKLFVGTSGFAYKEWKGVFYPEGTSDRQMLAHYSKILSSVEINYTFRRMPAETTISGWKEQTPEGFSFTLKAPQKITHIKRLKDAQEETDEFVRRARLLGDRLGSILFQLPPSMRFDPERLEKFLLHLAPVCRFAFEFRHESWGEAKQILAAHEVAWCGAETDESSLGEVPITASSYAYLRLRKEEYADDDVDAWAKRISDVLEGGRDVYCYFKHEGGGVGPAYAMRLKEVVG